MLWSHFPGTYNESIEVTTDRIVMRGEYRNTVVLDGKHELLNGIVVAANGVAVENMTVTGYRQNGVLFSGAYATEERGDTPGYNIAYGIDDYVVDGYRTSYGTTYNNGLYGFYAFAVRNAIFEHSYASGHPIRVFMWANVSLIMRCSAILLPRKTRLVTSALMHRVMYGWWNEKQCLEKPRGRPQLKSFFHASPITNTHTSNNDYRTRKRNQPVARSAPCCG